ncbi:hypothetical protein [Paenibacillus illinoisensis]|uniref:Uncharacterized protein n=1 Tax=Paenibacillus illinoisensis TaxID=59845 RepID=A0A2W0CAP5_9BACL|nr:hypothetical protein [Paenibacillus illinoisensis]PYY29760.1 Uncharacterized protein PIL02S_01960 [Paenibacillus illinoisensis]
MQLHIQRVIDKITGYMQAAARRGDQEASNAYDNALGCVQSLLDVYHSDEPFLISLSYTDYRPGMRIYMHTDYEHIKANEIIEIAQINRYELESATFFIQ